MAVPAFGAAMSRALARGIGQVVAESLIGAATGAKARKGGLDITVVGVPELQRKLNRLDNATQRKAVRPALRKSANRIKPRIVQNVMGGKIDVITGTYLGAWLKTKIRGSTRRGNIRVGITFPEREALGIAADDKHYYPTAIEYGHKRAPAHPHVRPAVDEAADVELRLIGRDIGKEIERLAKLK